MLVNVVGWIGLLPQLILLRTRESLDNSYVIQSLVDCRLIDWAGDPIDKMIFCDVPLDSPHVGSVNQLTEAKWRIYASN